MIGDVNDKCPRFDNPTYDGAMNIGDSLVLETDGINRLVIAASDEDVSVSKA